MGPVSQGSLNDLTNLALVIQALMEKGGVAKAIADLKVQMDAIVELGADVSAREAALNKSVEDIDKRIADSVEAETKANKKLADAEKRLAESREMLKAAKFAEAVAANKVLEAEEVIKQSTSELQKRIKAVEKAEATTADNLAISEATRIEYEEKLAKLKAITG